MGGMFREHKVTMILAVAIVAIVTIGYVTFVWSSSGGSRSNVNFLFTDINGNRYSLDSFRGKVVIIGFVSLWCGACKIQISNYEPVWRHYHDKLVVVIVDVDPGDSDKMLRPLARDYGDGGWIWVKSDSELIQKFDAFIVPKTLIIDPNGKPRFSHVGITSIETLINEVSGLVGGGS